MNSANDSKVISNVLRGHCNPSWHLKICSKFSASLLQKGQKYHLHRKYHKEGGRYVNYIFTLDEKSMTCYQMLLSEKSHVSLTCLLVELDTMDVLYLTA